MKRPSPADTPSLKAVKDAYNQQYTEMPFRDAPRFYAWLAKRIIAHLPPSREKAARILDVGCGAGYLLGALRRLKDRPLLALYGLDLSDHAVSLARGEAPDARLVLAQGERLPLCSGEFDAVVCSGNLEHFIDPARGTLELARVARADARVWILLPNSFYSGDIWRVITTGYGPNHHQLIDRFATVNEWRDFLESHGLAVESVEPYNRFKWWKRLLPRNLAYHFLYRARKREDDQTPTSDSNI